VSRPAESEFIAELSRIFGAHSAQLPVGIGDDAAVLPIANLQTVACADMAVEGVHFKREWSTPGQIGRKLTAANLADIYAMGAVPTYLLVTAALTDNFGITELRELAEGIKAEADKTGAIVVGGDLSSGAQLVLSITALGALPENRRPILRSGARVGDRVIVSGLPGKSAAGLAAHIAQRAEEFKEIVQHYKCPEVNYSIAKSFADANVSSMIDISDGLLSEAHHLSKASGVGMRIDSLQLRELPYFSNLQDEAESLGCDIWDWVLAGGEDHVFLATTSGAIPDGAYVIGEVTAGNGIEVAGVSPRKDMGWTHFN
jgi:thiamine-monophosphate kinase